VHRGPGVIARWLADGGGSDHALAQLDGGLSGAKGIRAVSTRFLELLTTGELLPTLLRVEGDTAFRLITDPAGGVRPRLVEMIAGEIQKEIDAGHYRPPEDAQLLAEGIVTLGERFLYNGGNPQANPAPETARRIIALLIREPHA
jgi:Tetracyclin repressor-like, C-terminal domain